MSHVHTFFMHMYHSFPSFWYYCWLVLFCFSLSLLDSLHMVPKRKSTPSWNTLPSRASSSSNPKPSHVRFRDDKARQDISENFSKHGIHSKRWAILLDFSDTDLPTVINSKGWESLCDILASCPFVIIQEFYSNMHRFDYSIPRFLTFV